jgi:hypothetical protein
MVGMQALIGTGVIGTVLQQSIAFDHVFNSQNINAINNYKFDTIYCAAPSSNRLLANKNPTTDLDNIKKLATVLTDSDTQIILISTIDVVVTDSPYATNRKFLEEQVMRLPNYKIVRLPSLIGSSIKKNILYDIKHNQYIESINALDSCQWYPLVNLANDLKLLTHNSITNFVSEPIVNQTILEKFSPKKLPLVKNKNENNYNVQPYLYNSSDIMAHMKEYFCD